MVHHRRHRCNGQRIAAHFPHIHQQHRQPICFAPPCRHWAGTRKQHHQVRIFSTGSPDFLAIDNKSVAFLLGSSAQRTRIGAATRFGNAKGLQAQLTRGDIWQIFLFLSLTAMSQNRPHRIHLRMASCRIAARAMNFF